MYYVCFRRFRGNAICGNVNIPYGTRLPVVNDILRMDGEMICTVRSQNSHDYFSLDDDGKGLIRGKLTEDINKLLQRPGKKHQARWDKVWEDMSLTKYKRPEHPDHWLWNHDFYCAPVEELERIKKMISEV